MFEAQASMLVLVLLLCCLALLPAALLQHLLHCLAPPAAFPQC
jgi:hypothetical protein